MKIEITMSLTFEELEVIKNALNHYLYADNVEDDKESVIKLLDKVNEELDLG
jgi:hypothetical protein